MTKAVPFDIPVTQLQLGLTIKLPLSWQDHPFLVNRITIENEAQIALIKRLNVSHVKVLSGAEHLVKNPQETAVTLETIPSQNYPKRDARQQARKSLRLSQRQFTDAETACRATFSKLGSDPSGAYQQALALSTELLEHMHDSEQANVAFVSTGDTESSLMQHGISVAVLALLLANALKLPKSDRVAVALGAIFHDVGKLKVPESIKRKRLPLTPSEMNFLRMHPNFGYDMLAKMGCFDEAVLKIVLYHHELIDGSGYPDGLTEKQLPITVQLVSLANDYYDLVINGDGLSPQVALGYLFKNRNGKHASTLISTLVKVLGIYPPGTLVQLSDGAIAKVMLTTTSVKQPQVLACSKDGGEVSLRFLEQESVTIDAVLKPEDVKEAVHRALHLEHGIGFYFSCAFLSD